MLGGGVEGNALLTSTVGAVLFVLLAAIGVTIVRLGPLISEHLFIGLALIGPVAVKLASTGYRFARYYTHNVSYRRKGSPALGLRLLAPLVVLSTVAVLASGVGLLIVGPGTHGPLRLIHKASFIVWVAVTALHILGHTSEMVELLRGKHTPRAGEGRTGRAIALAGGLVGGVVLALLLIPDFSPWVHAQGHSYRFGH
jgi:hypothetical protein